MTHLHEILAVDADTQKAAVAMQEEAAVSFQKKPHLYSGHIRKINYIDENRSAENLTDEDELGDTVQGKLDYVSKLVAKHYDILLTKEQTNTKAFSDLVLDGQVIASNLPATFLLGMESRLKGLRHMYLTLPTLDPSVKWTLDPSQGEGVYRGDMTPTHKTEKTIAYKVLVEATDKHPAQIEKWNEDRVVAVINTTRFSGMISPARKAEMITRIDKLISAVKQARQRANMAEVTQSKIGETIFDYIHKS